MIEFFFFVMIIFSAVWGSIFLGAYVKRLYGDHDSRSEDLLLAGLREETQQFEHRLARVEEELEFMRELNRPEPPTQLRSPKAGGTPDE